MGEIMGGEDRRRKYEVAIARLEGELSELNRTWGRIPRLLLSAALAIPAGYLWGAGAAWLVVVLAVTLTGTTTYFLSVRRAEWRERIADYKSAMRQGGGSV